MEIRWLASFIGLLALGCANQDDQLMTPKAQQVLAERLAQKQADLLKNCVEGIVQEAELVIDSLIKEEIYYKKIGAFDIPEKPIKPVRPNIPEEHDTTTIKPLVTQPGKQ